MLYNELVKSFVGLDDPIISESFEFVNAVRQWKQSQGMNPTISLNGDQAKEFLRSIGDPNPTDTLRQSGCATNTCDMTKRLSTSQLSTMSLVSQIKGLIEPTPGPAGPGRTPTSRRPRAATRTGSRRTPRRPGSPRPRMPISPRGRASRP